MGRRYFGTDGIRGRANKWPMTSEFALKTGMAAGLHFRGGNRAHRVVIGKDTRLSCYTIEHALTAGFAAVGMEVLLIGPIPTPGVAILTRSMRADLGVMISASHNGFEDNGIKLFGPDGYKLSDAVELAIEERLASDLQDQVASPDSMGRVRRLQGALGRYSEFCKNTNPRNMRLDGLRIVVDAANGAGYKVIPEALWELGAEVETIGVEPNGSNINLGCGSMAPELMCETVKLKGADIGIAVDGDADRVVIADELGNLIDGDQIIALVSDWMNRNGGLTGGGVVGTVVSNLGLQKFLEERELELFRTQVGDRYVVEKMRETGCNVGGEPAGHLVFSQHSTTGDGLIAALQVLAVLIKSQRRMSEIGRQFEAIPQVTLNVQCNDVEVLEQQGIKKTLELARRHLAPDGRLVVRPSGTEPKVRITTEHMDANLARATAEDIAETVRKASL